MPPRSPAKTPPPLPQRPWWAPKMTWEGAVLGFALAWGTVEILWLGARASSFTFITGMVVSTGVARLERRGRE